MKKLIFVSILISLTLVFLQESFSQNFPSGFTKRKQSVEETRLKAEFNAAKKSGDMNKISELQPELDKYTGAVSLQSGTSLGTFEPSERVVPPFKGDNINIVELSQLTGIQSLATATEQRGANVGRIWVVAAISNSTASDTVFYFRSDDGGISWTLYTRFIFGGGNEVSYDQMEVEIIEDNIGDKYLWTLFGLTNSAGKKYVGAVVIKTPTFQSNSFALFWPGENLNNTNFSRFRPRMTTDNSRYSNTANLYISASLDTISNNHKGGFSFAKCLNPYTTTPVVTYYPSPIDIIGSGSPTDWHSDIAYIHNGADSILFVGSHYSSAPALLGVGTLSTDFYIGLSAAVNLPNLSSFDKQYGRIACSGGTNQPNAMIVYRDNYQNSGDWDLKGYKSTNYGVSWNDFNIDVRRDNIVIPYPADIQAVRNRNNRFTIAYTIAGSSGYDTVKYLFTNYNSTNYFTRTINHLSGFERPRAGFRLVDNDSCFAVWSQKGGGSGNNIWAVDGCNGQISIGIQNIGSDIPESYSLGQNYPNPFNPLTNIKFSISKAGLVKLIVYDMLGKEVNILVNENLEPGIYKVDYDASNLSSSVYFYELIAGNYSEIKKMVLIK